MKRVFTTKVRRFLIQLCSCYKIIFKAVEEVKGLVRTIESHIADARRGEIVRSGIKLSIFGPQNAGKSSQLDFLGKPLFVGQFPCGFLSVIFAAHRDAAIVTPIPGTTKVILSPLLDIGGTVGDP